MSFATLLGTRGLIEEFKENGLVVQDRVRNFLRNELVTTQLGYGSYRVNSEDPEHHESLLIALQSGVNLIDTSANYSFGSAERLIGIVLSGMKEQSTRNNFILMSKAGYIQGPDLQYVAHRETEGKAFKEVLKPDSVCWYCIHPDFLKYQLNESLCRLQVTGLEVYLIQNPEYFFSSAKRDGVSLQDARVEFYARLTRAFEAMEEFCCNGLIKYYGICSNTLSVCQSDYNFICLDKVLDCARQASKNVNRDSGEHHFQVVQFPANLIEHQFITQLNQRQKVSLLERAEQLKLDVLINRPLIAYHNNNLLNLRKGQFEEGRDYLSDLSRLIGCLEDKEKFISDRIDESKQLAKFLPDENKDLFKMFQVGRELSSIWRTVEDADHFQSVVHRYLIPHTQRSVESLVQFADSYSGNALHDIDEYLGYFSEIEDLGIQFFNQDHYVNKLSPLLKGLEKVFLEKDDSWVTASFKYLADMPSSPIILNGMRKKSYVKSSGEFLIEDREDYMERLEVIKNHFPATSS